MNPLTIALKEWSAVCLALIAGRQSVLLRKGGIAEPSGDFRLEATRFLLYPTYVHQQETGLRDEAGPFLDEARRDCPPAGIVRSTAWTEVTGIYRVRDLLTAHLISHLHLLSDDAVEKRFHYRSPGIDVLAVRVHRLAEPITFRESLEQAGCKSWVPLASPIDVNGSTPVITDAQHRDAIVQLDKLLRPTAFA